MNDGAAGACRIDSWREPDVVAVSCVQFEIEIEIEIELNPYGCS
jgi:hypothetical protein